MYILLTGIKDNDLAISGVFKIYFFFLGGGEMCIIFNKRYKLIYFTLNLFLNHALRTNLTENTPLLIISFKT